MQFELLWDFSVVCLNSPKVLILGGHACVTDEHFFSLFKKSAARHLVVLCFLNRVFVTEWRGAQGDETSVWKTVVLGTVWTITYK
jgi:hypothetical protein